MKILVFGGTGRTGQVVCRVAVESGVEVLAPAHAVCPLEDAEAVSEMVLGSGAELVVNCAAISGLEACGDDPLRAHLINAVAPAAMALACRHTGARFVHLSTDYVLDGRRDGLKDESAKCRPACVYAESKREGELQVQEAWAESIIARVSWICGNPAKPGFAESVVAKALAGYPLAAIADKTSLPTDAEDIARVVLALASAGAKGVFHVCSRGEPMSWWDCARVALDEAVQGGMLPSVPEVGPQKLDEVSFFREPRPRHTAMVSTRLAAFGIFMPTAEETIRRAVRRWYGALKTSHAG
ncbi:MAG: NAD(P)-dependent oxidoreductase [Akkermansia sp.]|nr:NAD(P)-dependent oxidoreductase [Akkermansia sp.]